MAEKVHLSEDSEIKLLQELEKMKQKMYSRKCAICGKRQFKLVLPPKEVEIELWMWHDVCWKCGKTTPVVWVSPHSSIGGFNIYPDSFDELPKKISEIYPFFKITYSKTRNEEVYGNVCINCGVYQGNWYVWERTLEIAYKPEKISESREVKILLTDEERLLWAYPVEVENLEVHHISYNPEKTIVVCKDCHLKIHNTEMYPHLKPKDTATNKKKGELDKSLVESLLKELIDEEFPDLKPDNEDRSLLLKLYGLQNYEVLSEYIKKRLRQWKLRKGISYKQAVKLFAQAFPEIYRYLEDYLKRYSSR